MNTSLWMTRTCRSEFLYGIYGAYTVHRISASPYATRVCGTLIRFIRFFPWVTYIWEYIFSKKRVSNSSVYARVSSISHRINRINRIRHVCKPYKSTLAALYGF